MDFETQIAMRGEYFRDLDGANNIWYKLTGCSMLVPRRPNYKRVNLNNTRRILYALAPPGALIHYRRPLRSDSMFLMIMVHAVQFRCCMGKVEQYLFYARDIDLRYHGDRNPVRWAKVEALMHRCYPRFRQYVYEGIWMKGDRLTREFPVRKDNLCSMQVSTSPCHFCFHFTLC